MVWKENNHFSMRTGNRLFASRPPKSNSNPGFSSACVMLKTTWRREDR